MLLSIVVMGLVVPVALQRGVQPDEGLFIVEVESPSPLDEVLERAGRFHVEQGDGSLYEAGRADLFVYHDGFLVREDDVKSAAAAVELERTTLAWLDERLETEADQDAAFPLVVDLYYRSRDAFVPPDEPVDGPDNGTGGGGGPSNERPTPADRWNDSAEVVVGLRPNDVEPPFPLRSLLLTFAFVIPLNFITELFAGSLLGDRLLHRSLPLLSTPHGRTTILMGRTAPYAAMALIAALVVNVWLGAGLLGFVAILPVVMFVLSSGLLLSLLAANQRTLTAVLVAVNVLLSTFLFLPAVFTRIHPIAFISPVAVVAAAIRGESVTVFQFLYAVLPLTLVSLALFRLSIGLYREEHLSTPAPFLRRFIDGIEHTIWGRWGLLAAGAVAVPSALALEAITLVFALALSQQALFFVFLALAAMIEEALKLLPAYAYTGRRKRRISSFTVGALIGLGFFLGEKGVLIWSLLGLELLPLGEATLVTFGIATQIVLVIAPLFVHAIATTIATAIARRGRILLGWMAATLFHLAYNLSAIWFFLRLTEGSL